MTEKYPQLQPIIFDISNFPRAQIELQQITDDKQKLIIKNTTKEVRKGLLQILQDLMPELDLKRDMTSAMDFDRKISIYVTIPKNYQLQLKKN